MMKSLPNDSIYRVMPKRLRIILMSCVQSIDVDEKKKNRCSGRSRSMMQRHLM